MKSLYQGDCLEKMKDLSDNSVDIVIADLPYGRFKHLEWDKEIDLEKMWREIWRVGKDTCPVFLFGDIKFGVKLINSCPKYFRYEIVWNKKRTTTPLLSRKRLGKATEYVFIFYKKQPIYNYKKYHKIKNERWTNNNNQGTGKNVMCRVGKKDKRIEYNPKLPTNIVEKKSDYCTSSNFFTGQKQVVKRIIYEPLLPTNVLNHTNLVLGKEDMYHAKRAVYDPILPTNVIEQYSVRKNKVIKNITEKPQFLLEFLLKYFSNEGDTCLDMTMGSGSCGVACHTLNRNFIGIELNKEHFEIAEARLNSLHKEKKECIKSPLIQEVKQENIILSSAHQKTKAKKSQSLKRSKKMEK